MTIATDTRPTLATPTPTPAAELDPAEWQGGRPRPYTRYWAYVATQGVGETVILLGSHYGAHVDAPRAQYGRVFTSREGAELHPPTGAEGLELREIYWQGGYTGIWHAVEPVGEEPAAVEEPAAAEIAPARLDARGQLVPSHRAVTPYGCDWTMCEACTYKRGAAVTRCELLPAVEPARERVPVGYGIAPDIARFTAARAEELAALPGMRRMTPAEYRAAVEELDYRLDTAPSRSMAVGDYVNRGNDVPYAACGVSYTDRRTGRNWANGDVAPADRPRIAALQELRGSVVVYSRGRLWEL